MKDFSLDSNIYVQNILQLVSRGNAIIAEILRLKEYIPEVFRSQKNESSQKYSDVVFDFMYFKTADFQEKRIENSEELRDMDEEFRDNHIKIINRFYLIFEGIYMYITDLNRSLDDLDDGTFIHQTLETIFSDLEGKQLMCEALYLYGVMLLLLDSYIEGNVREKLLVSYYRYTPTPQHKDSQYAIDEICKLVRDTGCSNGKKSTNYPEDYFKRIPTKSTYVDTVIACLCSDDIYNQLSVYQGSKHRSTALSTQATMLFVSLFFCPKILHSQASVMREIVDKYFPDNWVISLYMGITINLVESWDNFKAAKMAIANTVAMQNVKFQANLYGSMVGNLIKSTANYLKEGNMTIENIMNDINPTMNILKDCNMTVRWLMLHLLRTEKNKKCKQLQDVIITEAKYDPTILFKLLLNTAQLEILVTEHLKSMLEEREKTWESLKNESCGNLKELSELFGGNTAISRIQKNSNLQNWFAEILKGIEMLSQDQNSSSKKIIKLIQALEQVQEFHQLEKNLHIIQYLSEVRTNLHKMLQTLSIKEESLIRLHIIADLSYGWILIDSFTPIMQKGIKKEPSLCIKLRAIFLKLASALETPLLRINQSHSKDLISVSQYYSGELEIYVRKVLQIIPETMFQKLLKIIEIQTSVLKELPTKLDKDKMKDLAQLKERFEFAELTNSISVYSQGIRMMKSTLVGVVCLDPKQLLQDGIRKELVQHITQALHFSLIFTQKKDDLEQRVDALAKLMKGYKLSFEYIQDYIKINGLKIWQEEVTRIINYNVEQECNTFVRNKVYEWESQHQSKHVPIPRFSSVDNYNGNFIGRLVKEILRLTDPRNTIFIPQNCTWYEVKTQKNVFNKETIKRIGNVIEIPGLVGLDKLLSHMVTYHLKKTIRAWEKKDQKNETWTSLKSIFCSTENINVSKFYQICINRMSKQFQNLLDSVLTIGQLQLLRNMVNFYLNLSCKFNAKDLESSLKALNKALVHKMLSKEENFLLNEQVLLTLSKYLDYCGMNRPENKIYVTTKFNEDYAFFLFIFVITSHQKLLFIKEPGFNTKKSQDKIDGIPFAMALHTIVRQYSPKLNESFIKYLITFIVESFKQNLRQKSTELPTEIFILIEFIEEYSSHSRLSEHIVREHLPTELHFLLDDLLP